MNNMGPNGFNPMMSMPGFNAGMPGMMQSFGNQNGFFPQNNYAGGYGGRGRGGYRGGYRGRGGYNNMHGGYNGHQMSQPPENFTVVAGPAEGPPIDAPKGPKAMREGLPNSGIYSRGGYHGGRNPVHPTPTPQPQSQPAQSPRPQIERSPSPVQENNERGRTASRSRSGSRNRKRKHSADTQDTEARDRKRDRRRHHDRKHEDERVDTEKKDTSRSSSADNSSHRRRRREREERDKHRSSRPHRDSSREYRHRRHRSRSARGDGDARNDAEDLASEAGGRRKGRRDRDRERERDRDRDRERDKDRKRSRRDRSASASGRRGGRRDDRDMAPPTDDQGFKIKGRQSKSFAPPTGPRKDRGARNRDHSDRRPSIQSVAAVPTESAVDPYAQEREARIKERMAKEQQRRESATLGKRPRDVTDDRRGEEKGDFDPPAGPRAERDKGRKSRKVSYKYEDDDESRASRVEREREAGRWK